MVMGAKASQGMASYFRSPEAAKSKHLARIADLLAQSNMNVHELQSIYRSSGHMNWVEAYKVGLLGKSFMEDVKGGANWRKPVAAGGHVFSLVAKTLDATMHPLFAYAIPRIEAGAFFTKMHDYLEANPHASAWEQVREAQRIADSIENVEGMMTQENVMVAPLMKNVAKLVLQAPGWTFGAARAYGQGAADLGRGAYKLARGKPETITENAAYVLSAAIVMSGLSAATQMFMGGGLPASPLDLIMPRTGGKNADGSDERLSVFGNVKDLVGYYHDWKGELAAKVRGPWRAGYQYFANHDWRGRVVQDPLDPWQKQMRDAVGNILKNTGEPISIQQWGTATPESHLSNTARAMGFTPAGQWAANPERARAFERRNEMKEHRLRLRSDRRDENRRAPVTKLKLSDTPVQRKKLRLAE